MSSKVTSSLKDGLLTGLSTPSVPHAKRGLPSVKSATGKSVASASELFTGWLWKSARSSADDTEVSQSTTDRGVYFPAKLSMVLGMAKVLLGSMIIAFGVLAILEKATMYDVGAGLWAGVTIIVNGILGIMAGKRAKKTAVYVISFLVTSILALAVTGLLLIFAASGLARDSNAPIGYFLDHEEGLPVEFLGTVPLRQRPVIVNAVIVALGTFDMILSLASIIICIKEACMCYSYPLHNGFMGSIPNLNLLATSSPEGHIRAERLVKWLKQNKPIPPTMLLPTPPPPPPMPQYYIPQVPFNSLPSIVPLYAHIPLPPDVMGAYNVFYNTEPHPASRSSRKSKSKLRSKSRRLHTVPEIPEKVTNSQETQTPTGSQTSQMSQTSQTESALIPKLDKKTIRAPSVKTSKAPSVISEVSQIYTGLDREIAEEFIQHSMEPHRSSSVISMVQTNPFDVPIDYDSDKD